MEMKKGEEDITMATKNDERVLQLKQVIDKKKTELKVSKKFTPLTNCVLDLEGQKYNLNVLQFDDLQLLLVRMNMYLMSAKDLKINLEISGYNIAEWIADIKCKIEIFEYKKKEAELRTLEAKLDKMLSDEKKTELELDEIAALLN